MKIYCDSSTTGACFIPESYKPIEAWYSEKVTNNEGEYLGVLMSLVWARNWRAKEASTEQEREHIIVFTDSLLVVQQVVGNWKCRKKKLLALRDRVRELTKETGAEVRWVSREENPAGKILG